MKRTKIDLLLGQVQLEDRFLPGNQQPLHVELGQTQKIALGCPRAAGDIPQFILRFPVPGGPFPESVHQHGIPVVRARCVSVVA